jgi:hypothetical protein
MLLSHTLPTAQRSPRLPSTQQRPQPPRRRRRKSTFSDLMTRRRMLRLPESAKRD